MDQRRKEQSNKPFLTNKQIPMRITLQTRLHEQARNKDKLNPSPKNIRMLVKQAIERGIEPYKHIFANIQQWEYPEHLNDKQALNFVKCMQSVTIGEVDQIIKEETN